MRRRRARSTRAECVGMEKEQEKMSKRKCHDAAVATIVLLAERFPNCFRLQTPGGRLRREFTTISIWRSKAPSPRAS
jgi:hypothetical protein